MVKTHLRRLALNGGIYSLKKMPVLNFKKSSRLSEKTLDILVYYDFSQVKQIEHENNMHVILQQDGALSHTISTSDTFLIRSFQNDGFVKPLSSSLSTEKPRFEPTKIYF